MIIKVIFESDKDYDYVYYPNNLNLQKNQIKENFYKWIDNSDEEHPFWYYENNKRVGKIFRGDAIVYWINKYLLANEYNNEKAYLIDSFSNKIINYDLKINL